MGEVTVFFLIGATCAMFAVWMRNRFSAFSGQRPQDYEDSEPVFDFKQHLNGKMVCEGMIFGPTGRMTSTFIADFDIVWTGDVGVISEHFTYDDRSTQDREWKITLSNDNGFTATAPDVVGSGRGVTAGPAVLFRYVIRLPEDAGGHALRAFDCMYLTAGGTIVNRSQFRKFGFKVAELVATIRPKGEV